MAISFSFYLAREETFFLHIGGANVEEEGKKSLHLKFGRKMLKGARIKGGGDREGGE